MNRNLLCFVLILVVAFSACSKKDVAPENPPSTTPVEDSTNTPPADSTSSDSSDTDKEPPSSGKMPMEVSPDIDILQYGSKISQLVGEYDRERKESTLNRTNSTYQLKETDLGVPFQFGNRIYVLFGDSHGAVPGDRDVIAYTTDTQPEDGLSLTFLHDDQNVFLPITIPSISMGAFEVPTEGVDVNGVMYVYATTDHTPAKTMGRSVLARSYDDGHTFQFLYSLSRMHFINVSIVKTEANKWSLLPEGMTGKVLVMFGSGDYRKSDVYLAVQPAAGIENSFSIRYFAGLDDKDKPIWSEKEKNAVPLFDQPQVGELSVTYNKYMDRWLMLYNASDPRGINLRTAKNPYGPWTEPQVIFDPWRDGGYCHFMHTNWLVQKCDSVMDPGRENVWGGEYGPYQYPSLAKGDKSTGETTIYFNMSTWNPYTVVLMKAKLGKK